MKLKPTNQQISEFMKILDEESETVLIVGEYVSAYQLLAIKEYGEFLALMPRDKYKKEIYSLTGKIKDYNSRLDKISYELISPKQFTAERKKLQKKAIKFRDSIIEPEKGLEKIYSPSKHRENHYADFVELLNLYIDDLDIREYHCTDYKVLPLTQFAKKLKVTKTPIRKCIEHILDTYKIKEYSREAKTLIDKLNNPPE